MSNKSNGNKFEKELCEILAKRGFWVHNLQQNSAGQPADIIACKDNHTLLIDCKDCTDGTFKLSRIEENQYLAMSKFMKCTGKSALFAMKYEDQIYIGLSIQLFYLKNFGIKSIRVKEQLPLEEYLQWF